MIDQQSTATAHNFFIEVNKMRKIFDAFFNEHQLSMYDIELLLIIYEAGNIQLKNLIQNDTIKINQVNKSIKKLHNLKLIMKRREPKDERTVNLCINQENKEEVISLLHRFSDMIKEIYT